MLDHTRGFAPGRVAGWRSGLTVAAIAGLVAVSVAACETDVITTVIGIPDTLSISVDPRSPGGQLGSVTDLTLAVGETKALRATALDALGLVVATPTITWTSTVPGVASVSGDGVVTAVSPGDAVITATAGDASTSAAITVTETTSVAVAAGG